MLAHGVALGEEHGDAGIALVLALAVGCAFADVGAFIVGRRFGRTPLAPRLSPNKTREGVVGNVLGAAVGLVWFVPALVPTFGWPFVLALVPLVAAGSLWGDLLESAAKREAGVKDAGAWLPGLRRDPRPHRLAPDHARARVLDRAPVGGRLMAARRAAGLAVLAGRGLRAGSSRPG